jgi:hypothetical protein
MAQLSFQTRTTETKTNQFTSLSASRCVSITSTTTTRRVPTNATPMIASGNIAAHLNQTTITTDLLQNHVWWVIDPIRGTPSDGLRMLERTWNEWQQLTTRPLVQKQWRSWMARIPIVSRLHEVDHSLIGPSWLPAGPSACYAESNKLCDPLVIRHISCSLDERKQRWKDWENGRYRWVYYVEPPPHVSRLPSKTSVRDEWMNYCREMGYLVPAHHVSVVLKDHNHTILKKIPHDSGGPLIRSMDHHPIPPLTSLIAQRLKDQAESSLLLARSPSTDLY